MKWGAVDSIVDILSVAICMDDLDVEEVIVPRLCEGSGTIRCQHGILPVPVPAVSNIVSAHHLKLHITPVQGELVTPTGAAIVAASLHQKNCRKILPWKRSASEPASASTNVRESSVPC